MKIEETKTKKTIDTTQDLPQLQPPQHKNHLPSQKLAQSQPQRTAGVKLHTRHLLRKNHIAQLPDGSHGDQNRDTGTLTWKLFTE